MIEKNASRLRRAAQTRRRIQQLAAIRLAVHRSNGHIYAQVFSADGGKVLASASTLEKEVRSKIAQGGNKAAAAAAGIETVAFDRSGYRYHGRVKALADAAREAGLKF